MTTPRDLTARMVDLLATIPETTTYVGHVPDTVPTIPGTVPAQIKPYIVIWPGGADDTTDQSLALCGSGFDWSATVTVVARNTAEVLVVAFEARAALHRQAGPGGSMYMQILNGARVGPDPDPTLKPTRAFLPLEFRATTTH